MPAEQRCESYAADFTTEELASQLGQKVRRQFIEANFTDSDTNTLEQHLLDEGFGLRLASDLTMEHDKTRELLWIYLMQPEGHSSRIASDHHIDTKRMEMTYDGSELTRTPLNEQDLALIVTIRNRLKFVEEL
jgi:hypothetical protein